MATIEEIEKWLDEENTTVEILPDGTVVKTKLIYTKEGGDSIMEEKRELRIKAAGFALELARGKNKTATEVVTDAEKIHNFLEPEKTEKDEDK